VLPQVSQRRVCQVLAVARSTVRRPGLVDRRRAGRVNEHLVTCLAALIQRHPTFGYRRLWAMLRFRDGQRIHPEDGLPDLRAQAMVRSPAASHAPAAGAGPDQSGGAEQ
jgi:hypothetical protein